MPRKRQRNNSGAPKIKENSQQIIWKWTKIVSVILSIILPALWLYLDPSVEAIFALIGSLVIVFTSWKIKKNKNSKLLDVIAAFLLIIVATISAIVVIKKQNTPETAIYPTLNFAPIQKDNGFTEGFIASFLEDNVKLEIAAIYYPTFFDLSILDEYIKQPTYKFYPYHLDTFLTGLYETLPMNPGIVEIGQGGNFPILIAPNYVADGQLKYFFGVYMVDCDWSRSENGVGVIFRTVRLIRVFDDSQTAQEALDVFAKIAVQNIVEYQLSWNEYSLNIQDGEIMIAGKGESISISIEDILNQK